MGKIHQLDKAMECKLTSSAAAESFSFTLAETYIQM